MTGSGVCEVAALSKYNNGCPFTCRCNMGKSARICVISSVVLYIKTNIYTQFFGNQFIDAFFNRVDFNALKHVVGKGIGQ